MGAFDGAAAAALVGELRDEFASGKTRTEAWRVEQLKGIARFTGERQKEIVGALQADLGKPAFEAVFAEVKGTGAAASNAAANVKSWMVPAKVTAGGIGVNLSNAAIRPEPLGVVLIISPWNYPFVLSLEPMVGAIAAGNTVVLKPSELAPASSAVMAEFLPQYVDRAAVRVIEGGIPETTALLEQRWDKIFYTGSTRVGKIIMTAAAKHLTPVTLELGGKSPTIVDSTPPDLEIVAKRISRAKWAANNGQTCISPDYVIAEESIVPELVEKFKGAIKQFYGEDPLSSADRSRIINSHHFDRLVGMLKDEGTRSKIVHGGKSKKEILSIEPTLVVDPPVDSLIMQEEIFGPLLVIMSVKNVDEAIKFVTSRPKPLALYMFTADQAVTERILQETSSGGVTVNDCIVHVRHSGLPFGGVGDSGMGSYHGKFSFDTFSHKKSVCYQDLTESGTAMYPPYK